MVAMAPLIAVQLMGFRYNIKLKKSISLSAILLDIDDDEIVEFEEE